MDTKAVNHAENWLHSAQEAVEVLRQNGAFRETERAWSTFVVAVGTIYNKLEQGAKVSASSKSWFDTVKSERRSDQLLQYLHQARNAEAHGIIDLTTRHARLLTQPLRFPDGKTAELRVQLPPGEVDFTLSEGEGQPATFDGPQTISEAVALVPVTNRSVTYAVPQEHLGHPFGAVSVLNVAEAGLLYVTSLVAKARALA